MTDRLAMRSLRQAMRIAPLAKTADSPRETMLLLTLREVSDLVSNSHDLAETLANIVRHLQRRIGAHVCSVYLVERETGDLVLSATVGLRPEAVGCVRMGISEGLTGMVAETKSAVSVEDAPSHPRFRYFPESGEEAYRSFLGVPLVQGGVVQGVLVVQHREPRHYSTNEIRLMVGLAAQLAILVTNARLTRELNDAVHRPEPAANDHRLAARLSQVQGLPASPGFGHGRAVRFEQFDFADPRLISRSPGSIPEERERLAAALAKGRDDIDKAAQNLADLLGEQFGALMQAQRLMLEDSSVQRDLDRLIETGHSVEQAVVKVCAEYLRAFQKLENPFFYERIYDIKDVFRRVLHHAAPTPSNGQSSESVVAVAHEVSLLELFTCDLTTVRGIVVEKGGAYSHVAILARSLGIPMLTHAHQIVEAVRDGDDLFIDADAGVVYINPDPVRRRMCLNLLEHRDASKESDDPDGPALPISLQTTVNLLPEIARTVQCGAESVGLYRSEFLELARRSFPTEEDQLLVYRKMLEMLAGRPLTLRTLDLRTEKLFGLVNNPGIHQQSWEWRLVDSLPHVQDVVRAQLRATLRAASYGPMRILFPMITSQRQLSCALDLLRQARASLEEEGLEFGRDVPIGLMVEAPVAAVHVADWGKQVDFVCVGTNDLLHSLLGIDRNDDQLVALKTPLDPMFLRTVRTIVRQAKRIGRPVTICGEAASNQRSALAFVAMEVNALSVPPEDLPKIRRRLRGANWPQDLAPLRRRLLKAEDAHDVERILDETFPT